MWMHLIHFLKRNLRRIISAHGTVEENCVAAFEFLKVSRGSGGCACGMPDRFSTGLARIQWGISTCLCASVAGRVGEASPKIVLHDSFFSGFRKRDNHSENRQHWTLNIQTCNIRSTHIFGRLQRLVLDFVIDQWLSTIFVELLAR